MKYFLLITSIIISICSKGQDNSINKSIETEIQSKNEFDISIIKVFPQDFPNVSVVFQAKNQAGEPLWLLTKDDFKVKENTLKCEVLDVRNISENKPLNIALVFDHSGSMIENPFVFGGEKSKSL